MKQFPDKVLKNWEPIFLKLNKEEKNGDKKLFSVMEVFALKLWRVLVLKTFHSTFRPFSHCGGGYFIKLLS